MIGAIAPRPLGPEALGPIAIAPSNTGERDGVAVEATTVTLAGAGWDLTQLAMLRGAAGSNRTGAYVETATSYAYSLHTDGAGNVVGYNPGQWVAALDGKTGIPVTHAAGLRTAAQVAADYRSATGWGGSGADLEVPNYVGVGDSWASRGGAQMWGNRAQVNAQTGGAMGEVLATHGVSPTGERLLTAIAVYLVGADPSEEIKVALYLGGDASDYTAAVLLMSRVFTASGTGWAILPLTPSEVAFLNADDVWALVGGITLTTMPGFSGLALDWTDQNVLQLDVDPDPDVAFPASLVAASTTANYNLRQMIALELRAAPYVGDGSWEAVIGVRSDDVLGSSLQSDLPGPGGSGANVQMAMQTPNMPGMVVVRSEVAVGTEHTTQFRVGLRAGGSIGNPTGSTRVSDLGATTGSSTNAWAQSSAGVGDAVAANTLVHLGIRSNTGTVSVRYAAWDSGLVDPPGSPVDFVGGVLSEYESGAANASYSTNQAVAIESSFTADASDIQPGNYPGMRLLVRVVGDAES